MTTTAEVVHSSECASKNVSDEDRERGVWAACNCGALERADAAKNASTFEDRAGAYLYSAWSAYTRAGNEEKAAAMSTALEAIGRAPE